MEDNFNINDDLIKFSRFIYQTLTAPDIQSTPDSCVSNEDIAKLYDYIMSLRKIYWAFAQGNFYYNVDIRGALGGAAKSLQANLRHLSWQVQMVAEGDFSQKVDFMGELSSSFNTMITRFEQTLSDLTEQKELLKEMAEDLHKEVINRKKIEKALKQSEKRYRTLSRLDPLTNIYNRRYFFELAVSELDRMVRNSSGECTVAMIDIDHFKRFNDNYGHQTGDMCLRKVAEVLKKNIRSFDLAGRYGGEEFIMLLPAADKKEGYTVLERIRKIIEQTKIKTKNHGMLFITVSIGYSTILISNETTGRSSEILKKAIAKADKALYKVKHDNRNQVLIYEERAKH